MITRETGWRESLFFFVVLLFNGYRTAIGTNIARKQISYHNIFILFYPIVSQGHWTTDDIATMAYRRSTDDCLLWS